MKTVGLRGSLKLMKILAISNLFPNSAEPGRGIFNKQQFVELARLCDLRVMAPLPWYSKKTIPQEESIDGIKTYHYRYFMIPKICRSLYGIFFYISLLPNIKRLHKKFKFDAILATWAYPDAFGSYLIAKYLRRPIVIKVHGTDINLYSRYFLRRKMIVWALSNSDKVIAVSVALKDQMVKIGVPSEKIVVIPNGVNADLFAPMDHVECRRKLGLTLNKKIILFVGNLVKIKGVETLVTAFAGLRVNGLLVLVGDGPLEGTLRAKVKAMGIEDSVIFAGRKPHDEIRYYMNACDVFCLPSVNEGCPNVLLEAVACGKYIVATRVGGIPEIIESDKIGIMVEPDKPAELMEALKRGLEMAGISGKASSSKISYTWKQSAERLGGVLKTVICRPQTEDHRPQTIDLRHQIKNMVKELVYTITPKSIIAWRGNRNKKLVALTFDDGPNSKFTPKILETLKNNSVKATFFLVGQEVAKNTGLAKDIISRGHSVGLHSYAHRGYKGMCNKDKMHEISMTGQMIEKELGVKSNVFRPPQGALSISQVLHCKKNNITTVMWSLDSDDFRVKDAELLVAKTSGNGIKNGEIILFHDDNEFTVAALPQIITDLRARGFDFATVEEILK
jgi:glycosyltransferase involved in cell wall biosynthesis/peptidoglycan/xylan/chitin deacetylase (PgdA/CDA1 family)